MSVFRGPKNQSVESLNDWRQLGDPKNWVDGRSAKRLAETWFPPADGFPANVSAALERQSSLSDLAVTDAIVEHLVRVPGKGPGSATDIMVHARSPKTTISIAVEGKVDEGFDQIVSTWLTAGDSPNSPLRRWLAHSKPNVLIN